MKRALLLVLLAGCTTRGEWGYRTGTRFELKQEPDGRFTTPLIGDAPDKIVAWYSNIYEMFVGDWEWTLLVELQNPVAGETLQVPSDRARATYHDGWSFVARPEGIKGRIVVTRRTADEIQLNIDLEITGDRLEWDEDICKPIGTEVRRYQRHPTFSRSSNDPR